jgi:hypothetical protein
MKRESLPSRGKKTRKRSRPKMMLPLWIDLVKARKGERVGGKYIHRWWNSGQNKWNYKYSDKPHPQHGIPYVATSSHTIEVHPSVKSEASPEEAFHQSARAELKHGEEQKATFKNPSGEVLFTVHVKPGLDNPIHVAPPGTQ